MNSGTSKRFLSWASLITLSVLLAAPPAFSDNGEGNSKGIRHVDCANRNASIQKEVDKVTHTEPTTIVIRGTCTEEVVVRKDDLTLLAHADGGTVDGSIYVIDAQRVTVEGLRVVGSGDGVGALDNAGVTVKNATLEDNGGSGVLATRGAVVSLWGNTIRQNDEYGVLVTDGANAQIRAGNTIESDVPNFFVGAAVGGFRHATIRIRDGDNTITNSAKVAPVDPRSSSSAAGYAIDVEHGTILRQDNGHATIDGHVEIFNLTSADFRDMNLSGHIFVDGLNANVRVRNSAIEGGMNMFGEASFRSNVTFTGDIHCNFRFLSTAFVHIGNRIDCFP